ncbi:hypothetical protein H0H93_011556 [Arthromyces matolae]|nr:hypothetical protein H0H93_011556 [Arthromyces matolae]
MSMATLLLKLINSYTGHGFCHTPCIDNYFSLGTSKLLILCPVCRSKLRRVDARSLYLELPTPQEVQTVTTENLVHALAQMNENSKAVSIQTARQKLMGYADTSDCGKDCATVLLNALAQFNERIIPTFQKVEDQRKEIDLLMVQLKQRQQCMDDRQGRIDTLVKERDQARNALQVTQAERDSALDLASQAAEKMLQLRADLTQARGQEYDLQESKALYRTQLLDYKELQRKQNEKIKSLKKQLLVAKRAETSRRQEIDVEPRSPPGKSYKPQSSLLRLYSVSG